MGKKNLEQLFQESFQDFQEVPNQKVWDNIEASLNNKKQKKRAIPIWWSLGGIAATLAILMLVFNPLTENKEKEQIISDIENTSDPKSLENTENNTESLTNPSKGSQLTEQNKIQTPNQKIESSADTEMTKNGVPNPKKHGLTVATRTANNLNKSKTSAVPKNAILNDTDVIARNRDTITSVKNQAISESQQNVEIVASTEEKKDKAEKKSIYEAIAEQQDEKEALATTPSGKWSVGPSLAPVYFDASGDGSPVGSDFTSNSKSGKLNLSYGLAIAYEIGKKVKIRSGVHRVNYGYNTNDVVFSSTLRSASGDKIANIDYSQNSESIVVESKENSKKTPSLSSKEIALNEAPSLDGRMVQQLGYIEVPLEVNYAVLDKKFGIDLIGGVSSLFLVDNSILLESNDLITEMGEANNINSLNFSANLGMGLNYQFSPKIRFNVEPVFKYQLNTFSNVSGNFQPYSIGVYSGFSFRF
ncbi:outer membrane beta-barrel protein [Allomuricauda sp. F6463D]|uniref:outer membrane beta-barrel protein n=1 Tax=Allomuricauda sp. F6463D TaxID=2926409 RepID=UPI001FF4DB19|nr:outer membrane beta-barrel protein [Muricauda sp. F6463D]MCK0161146.1 outer membrane beta-barrel protein [Muricauda sp. F6463D]